MKALKITLYTLGIVVLLGGIGLFLGGMNVLNWKFEDIDTTQLALQTRRIEQVERLSKVNIDSDMNIELVGTDNDFIEIDYFTSEERIDNQIHWEDNVLTVKIDISYNFANVSGFSKIKIGKAIVKIRVPQLLMEELSIQINNSNLTVSHLEARQINIDVKHSNLKIDNVRFQKMEMNLNDSNLTIVLQNSSQLYRIEQVLKDSNSNLEQRLPDIWFFWLKIVANDSNIMGSYQG